MLERIRARAAEHPRRIVFPEAEDPRVREACEILRRDAAIRVKRGGEVVHDSAIASLRREKDEVREVKDGFECGIRLRGCDDVQEQDVVEVYEVQEIKRSLEDVAAAEPED